MYNCASYATTLQADVAELFGAVNPRQRTSHQLLVFLASEFERTGLIDAVEERFGTDGDGDRYLERQLIDRFINELGLDRIRRLKEASDSARLATRVIHPTAGCPLIPA